MKKKIDTQRPLPAEGTFHKGYKPEPHPTSKIPSPFKVVNSTPTSADPAPAAPPATPTPSAAPKKAD